MNNDQHALSSTTNQAVSLVFLIPSLRGGGAERVLITLANDFYVKGYAVTIVSINNEVATYQIKKGIDIVYLVDRKQHSIMHRIYYAVQVLYKLVLILRKLRPICMISFITSANVIGALACQITRSDYILSERTSPNRTIKKFGYIKNKIVAELYKKAKAVVVGCQGVERCLLANKNFETLTNIKKIPNWVTTFGHASGRAIHGRRFILGVGRLCSVKGFDQLIKAFADANITDLDLVIVGEGEERDNLTQLITDLKLTENIFLVGAKTNLQDYYGQAEMFVLSSRNEGYPNVLVEAMSFGCPSITVDCEFGPSEIIYNEHNGLLVEQNNLRELTEGILKLRNNPVLRARLSSNALAIKQTNDKKRLFSVWEQLIVN